MGRYGVWVLMAVLLGGCEAHGAERKAEGRPGTLRLETERVVVFKDGYALLVKRAEAVADARGTVFTDEVPENAVLGTFWAWSERGPAVRAMRAEWVEQEVDKEERGACTDPAAILSANPGKRVTIEVEGATLTGTVLPVPAAVAAAVPAQSLRYGLSGLEASVPVIPPHTPVVALKVPERGTVVLAGRDIRRVEGLELSLECKRTVHLTERRKRLSLDFGAEAAGKNLAVRLVYFTPGLRWVPTYRLDLKDGGKGQLSLQAELLNELEDLRGANVDLIVGVPNFRFRDVSSPLSLEGAVRQTLAQAAPSLMNSMNIANNATFSQNAAEWDGAQQARSAAPNLPDLGGGGDSPDFFLHSVPGLVLAKGARALVPLWREEVPVRDLYTLDVRVRRNPNDSDSVLYGSSESGRVSPLRLARGEVWHQLELKNDTKYPLTTGPVLVMRGQVPQAQELLTYTPRGGSTLVPLTIATDVRTLHEETELERKLDALKRNGLSFSLIRKKGTLALSNPRGERTPLRIRLSTGGKVEQVSDGGRVKPDDYRSEDWGSSTLEAVNTHSDVEWTLTLEPGERRTLTYEVGFWR